MDEEQPARTVVLVEGESDRVAVETLAERHGRDLRLEGAAVLPIGGAQALGRVLARLAADGSPALVAGLCDAGEEADFRRALERAGRGPLRTRADLERLGFFVCERDLEDELIRALGTDAVETLLIAHGDLRPFRTLQKQPAWHGREPVEQLRRFLGSGSGRKIRYARHLVEALDLARVPRPLERLLARI